MTEAADPIKNPQDTCEITPKLLRQFSERGFVGGCPPHGHCVCAPCRASRWCVRPWSSAGTTTPRRGWQRSAWPSASASSSTTIGCQEGAALRRRFPKTAPSPPPSSAGLEAPERREAAPRRVQLGQGRSLDQCLDLLPGGLRLPLLPLGSSSGQGDVFWELKAGGVAVIP